MTERVTNAGEAIRLARAELRRGHNEQARKWAQRAASLAPDHEEPWLVLAAVSPPDKSIGYVRRALEIKPDSPRGLKAMAWAVRRLSDGPAGKPQPPTQKGGAARAARAGMGPPQITADKAGTQPTSPVLPSRSQVATRAPPTAATQPVRRRPTRRRKNGALVLALLMVVFGCVVVSAAALFALTSPAMASILGAGGLPVPAATHGPSYAQVIIPKPSPTATGVTSPELASEEELGGNVTSSETPSVDAAPTEESLPEVPGTTPESALLPVPTETPGVMYAEIVPDTPTAEYVPPTARPADSDGAPAYAGAGSGEHWIDVDLSQQRVYAYEGDTVVNSFLVSTGTWQTPTVTGRYNVWIKRRSTSMTGPGYYRPNVPYVMYFYKGYGLHGTYWHNNFGTPMSHGCVNLTIADAAWLYDFSSVGTVVNVHY